MTPFEVAKKYIGQTEKPANSGFNDAVFEQKMKQVGFVKSHAWCCYFAELVFKEAFPEKFAALDKLFSASTIQTFENFKNAEYKISALPVENTLVIFQTMRNGKPEWTGHAAICGPVTDGWKFESIEGNTSGSGSREGIMVAKRIRKTIKDVDNGLKVLGFIHI